MDKTDKKRAIVCAVCFEKSRYNKDIKSRKGCEYMKLTFLGAAHEVTGSCSLLEVNGKHILIDCGMEQGPDLYENQPLPLEAGDVDALLLTHAHIDHSGKIPLLCRQGFRGPIYCTGATADLCDIMLRDSAHIQEFEAEWRNRKARRAGLPEYVPLYTIQDAVNAMKQFSPCRYGEVVQVCEGVTIRFVDVGHLLGSASIEIWAKEDGEEKTIVFSGDIGNVEQPLLKNPCYIQQADVVVMESTYGNRSHAPQPDYVGNLAKVIQQTFDRGGNIVVPCFAVGRTQEMLYFLRQIKQNNLVKGHGNFPVYVDSPLAVEATGIFHNSHWEYFDEETRLLLENGIDPIRCPGLKLAVTTEESQAINSDKRCKVILSASGMCEAGRIKHHLKHNLWRPECSVLFVGYQAVGTLGRALVEGATEVRLFGETIQVRAQVLQLPGMSGHADREGLLKWVNAVEPKPSQVYVNHGGNEVCEEFAALLREQGYTVQVPYSGSQYNLVTGQELAPGNRTKIEKSESEGESRQTAVFRRLMEAGKRLMTVIGHNKGGANKDLAKFADQIQALCEKWDR